MGIMLEGNELSDIIGQGVGAKFGWPAGTPIEVTLTLDLNDPAKPRVYATVERKDVPTKGKKSHAP